MNRKKIISLLLIISWLGVIFYLSSMDTYKSNDSSKEVISAVVDNIIDNDNIGTRDVKNNKKEDIIINLNYPLRKCAHASVYFILALLFMNFFVIDKKRKMKNLVLISIFFCFLYAITDEFHQIFVNGRTGKFSDVIIDTLGASIGCFIYSRIYKKRLKY